MLCVYSLYKYFICFSVTHFKEIQGGPNGILKITPYPAELKRLSILSNQLITIIWSLE